MKIIDKEYLKNSKVGKTKTISLYSGDRFANVAAKTSDLLHSETFDIKQANWQGSSSQAKLRENMKALRQKLQNANTGYDYAAIKELVTSYLIDIARQADDLTDYTDTLLATISDADMPQIVNLRSYLPFVGQEKIIKGSNDSVPLIEEQLPSVSLLRLTSRHSDIRIL
jgi:hypothetical protein